MNIKARYKLYNNRLVLENVAGYKTLDLVYRRLGDYIAKDNYSNKVYLLVTLRISRVLGGIELFLLYKRSFKYKLLDKVEILRISRELVNYSIV